MAGDVIRGPWRREDDPEDWPPAGWRRGRPANRSTAWADTPSSSGYRCDWCGRPFAAGHLPTDGQLRCRDCRAELATPTDPQLFED